MFVIISSLCSSWQISTATSVPPLLYSDEDGHCKDQPEGFQGGSIEGGWYGSGGGWECTKNQAEQTLRAHAHTKLSTREVEVNEKKIGEDMQPVIQPRRRIPLLNDPPMASHNDNIMVITDKKWDGKEKQVCNKVSGLFL